VAAVSTEPKTLDELLKLPPEQLCKVDLARMNLLCATGLPGAEEMNVEACLTERDRYAEIAKVQIEKYLPMYQRNPARFQNIEGFYRMQMLVTVLKQDLKLDYNPARQNDEPWQTFYADSRDLLLNGLLAVPHLGTCGSLPVVVTAVAQKLGYPVHLVSTKGHMFCRWEDSTGRFNIECTNGGMSSHPDEYYTQGVFATDDPIYANEHFLQTMTPVQCLADFLSTRGLCLKANQRYADSVVAYQEAARVNPESKLLAAKLEVANKQLAKYASAATK